MAEGVVHDRLTIDSGQMHYSVVRRYNACCRGVFVSQLPSSIPLAWMAKHYWSLENPREWSARSLPFARCVPGELTLYRYVSQYVHCTRDRVSDKKTGNKFIPWKKGGGGGGKKDQPHLLFRVDLLLSYDSKTTEIREQYDWKAGKKFGRVPSTSLEHEHKKMDWTQFLVCAWF